LGENGRLSGMRGGGGNERSTSKVETKRGGGKRRIKEQRHPTGEVGTLRLVPGGVQTDLKKKGGGDGGFSGRWLVGARKRRKTGEK